MEVRIMTDTQLKSLLRAIGNIAVEIAKLRQQLERTAKVQPILGGKSNLDDIDK